MTNIPTDLLRTLIAVVDLRSFTKAGVQLGVTQPGVSAQIKRLQVLLGGELFDRTAPVIGLTPHGEMVVGYARRLLSINDQIVHLGDGPRRSWPSASARRATSWRRRYPHACADARALAGCALYRALRFLRSARARPAQRRTRSSDRPVDESAVRCAAFLAAAGRLGARGGARARSKSAGTARFLWRKLHLYPPGDAGAEGGWAWTARRYLQVRASPVSTARSKPGSAS